jgi:putative ABC transport system substrate-binding protein
MIFSAVFFGSRLEQLAMLAARHRVPASYQFREFASAGGLMSYGINRTAPIVRLVSMPAVSSRAKSRPTCRSCSQPSFEFVINLKTAKALGLSIPDNLLALADEVIE